MRIYIFILFIGFLDVFRGNPVVAQMTIGSGTKVMAFPGTNLTINGDFVNNSQDANLSGIDLILEGVNQVITSNGNIPFTSLGGLIVNGGGIKQVNGNWEIARTLKFQDGIVVPQGSSKIIHTLADGQVNNLPTVSSTSFVNGVFYSRGKGLRMFPIGNGSVGLAPALLSGVVNGDLELGMKVMEGNSISGLLPNDVSSIFQERYWELLDASNTFENAQIVLSTSSAISFFNQNGGTVVIGAPKGGPAENLNSQAASGGYLASELPISATHRIFSFGKVATAKIVIHNVVTPNNDMVNDFLVIDNIEKFPENKVRMLDRWGVQVKEWSGFVNPIGGSTDIQSYDLSKIPTGNYIVTLEYLDAGSQKKLSQMVTIINQ